jgi:hypothetical protein
MVTDIGTEDIWAIVESCRRDAVKQPKNEPCRFCGNICTSWKKLTVHLAKHMEQISMPILPLVSQKQLNADSIISPIVELPESRKLSITPTRSPMDNALLYNTSSTYAPGIDPQSLFPQDTKPQVASTTMQTYPPPQMVPPSNHINGYTNYGANNAGNYSNQTYPGLQIPPKPHNGYSGILQIPSQSYQHGSIPSGIQQYGMTPVSTVQQQQSMYTDSPVETSISPFPSYYAQESQGLTTEVSSMGYDGSNEIHHQQGSACPNVSYLTAQHNYQYPHQQ